MSRHHAIGRSRALGLIGLACLALQTVAAAGQTERPPNVVLIIADDYGWTDYGFMGHKVISTPNLDRLAAAGMVFERGYVPTSLCRPSLATILTGLYPHQHGIVGNDPAPVGDPTQQESNRAALISRLDEVATLPGLLAERNYLSFQAGKWWEGGFERGGFTHGMTKGPPERGARHGDQGLKIGRQGLEEVFSFVETATRQHRPFFLWYAPYMPHLPHNPPFRTYWKYRLRSWSRPLARYWAMCEWFDETVGQLLHFLDARGLAEDTLVIFLADNGWVNDLSGPRHDPRSKGSPYDAGVRTPVVLRWPGRVPAARDRASPISSLDIAPTVLAAVGLPIPDAMEGINLLSKKGVRRRVRIYGEIFEHDVRDVNDPIKSLRYRWVIQGAYKLVLPHTRGTASPEAAQLYDLKADPDERHDLAASQPARVRLLQLALDSWWPAAPAEKR